MLQVLYVALTRIFGTRISLLRLHNIAIRSWMPLDQDQSTRRKNGNHITSCRKKNARFKFYRTSKSKKKKKKKKRQRLEKQYVFSMKTTGFSCCSI